MQTYNPVPYFGWQTLKPVPAYHHDVIRSLYLGPVLRRYQASHSIVGLGQIELSVLVQLWSFFLGPVLTLPLLLAVATVPYGSSWKDVGEDTRFLLLVCGAVTAAIMLSLHSNPHYAAPITCAIYALVLHGMCRVRCWQWSANITGLFITRAVPAVCLLLLLLRVCAGPLRLSQPPEWPGPGMPNWCSPRPTNPERAKMLRRLGQYPGRHLVIVHYNPNHEIAFHEWVYNSALIDDSKVVLARDMGAAGNAELVTYFNNRRVWLLNADDCPPTLASYPVPADQPSRSAAQGGT
jgi:hypothetical protein